MDIMNKDATVEKLSVMDNFISDFEIHWDEILKDNSAVIQVIRKKAIVCFEKLGIPTKKNEEWKYTDVNAVLKDDYVQQFSYNKSRLTIKDIEPFLIPGLDAHIVVIENGRYVENLSSVNTGKDVILCSFAEALMNHANKVERYFASHADIRSDAFIALNTAFAQDGVFLFINDGAKDEKAIHIININSNKHDLPGGNENLFIQPRKLFVAGKSTKVKIIESFHAVDPEGAKAVPCKYFINSVTEIICRENSNIDHYQIQNASNGNAINHISSIQVYQEANSVFHTNTITLTGAFTRNNLNIVPGAEGCETHLYGLYYIFGKQHVDNHTLVDHKKPNCYSKELYLGILDDRSTGVFNGKVYVRKNAQKTNAYQSNKNILLTENAKINTKPQLEIYADDVKCSHGATIGQLDRESLFYLRSRGIEEEKARKMLLHGFINEVIEKIEITPLRNAVNTMIADKLS